MFVHVCEQLIREGCFVRFSAEGTSMRPTIQDGDAITVGPMGGRTIQRGDIVLYRQRDRPVVHRIVEVRRTAEARSLLVPRGDGKSACDAPIEPHQVIGRVVAIERGTQPTIAARLFRRIRRPEPFAVSKDALWDGRLCTMLVEGGLPGELAPEDLDALWERAVFQDLDAPIAAVLLRGNAAMPAALRARVASRLADAELRDLLRYRELCRIGASFASAGVDVLLLKGAGLAHTVYPEPHFRPSRDIDLWITLATREAAEGALAACGYSRMREPDMELARAQRQFVRRDGAGLNHFVDLHWRVSNARLFADALVFDEVWNASMALPSVEPTTRTLGVVDALRLACIHRVAHHQDAHDLLWLWDIHLLAGHLTADDWATFAERAEKTRTCAAASRGLELSRVYFGTEFSGDLFERLRTAGAVEPTKGFLGGNLRTLDVVRADLAATRGWRTRVLLVREHLFPPRAYMLAMYARWPAALLPIAYLDRIIRGAPKWFRRPPPAGAGEPRANA
jgi:hypothetical protein